MPDDKKKEPTEQIGKQWEGQKFAPTKTIAQVQANIDLQAEYDHPDAITLAVYITIKGVRDPVMQAAMTGHTNVQRATKEAWDTIFATF